MKELNAALGEFMLRHFEDEGPEHILKCQCPACVLWKKVSAMGEKRKVFVLSTGSVASVYANEEDIPAGANASPYWIKEMEIR